MCQKVKNDGGLDLIPAGTYSQFSRHLLLLDKEKIPLNSLSAKSVDLIHPPTFNSLNPRWETM